MNALEINHLMYLKAKPEVFTEYGVTEQGTPLASGDVFIHAGKCGTMAMTSRGDARVEGYTYDAMMAYIEYVDGYKGGDDGSTTI